MANETLIEVKNLKKIYKSRKAGNVVALNDVSFALPDKGMVFFLGKSGCGKSTLLNVLGGLDSFDGGEIIVGGRSIKNFTSKERVGILMLAAFAACNTVEPSGTLTGIPFIFKLTILLLSHNSQTYYFFTIAPNLQCAIHCPHLIHLAVSMTWGLLTSPEIALAGQLRLHSVQPLHLSGSI